MGLVQQPVRPAGGSVGSVVCACPPLDAGVKYRSLSLAGDRLLARACVGEQLNGALSRHRLAGPARTRGNLELCYLRARGLARNPFRSAASATPGLEGRGRGAPFRPHPRYRSSRSRLHGDPPALVGTRPIPALNHEQDAPVVPRYEGRSSRLTYGLRPLTLGCLLRTKSPSNIFDFVVDVLKALVKPAEVFEVFPLVNLFV